MKPRKQWQVLQEPPADIFENLGFIPRPVARVLYHRGIFHADNARNFFNDQPSSVPDPFLLTDMDRAVDRLQKALQSKEPIVIYGDYDTDGVTATAMLTDYLKRRGGRVESYIPSRFDEGYGLNCGALENLARKGARVVLTVDCGARSIEEARYAKTLGLDLLITDHHPPGAEEPPGYAFIDPRRDGCPYPEKDLAGVGVAFRLLQALETRLGDLANACSDSYLDLVAIGTVADMVPLLGENRSLVQSGLKKLNAVSPAGLRPGLDQLLKIAGVRPGSINATTIGFILGPRLNAAGRLESAETALSLLLESDPKTAENYASLLEKRNRERQTLTKTTYLEARQIILDSMPQTADNPSFFLMAGKEGFNPGVIGLAASKLMDEFHRPSAVVALEGKFAKGSIRSIPGFHITDALDSCRELLERYGGHAAAAGFTIRADRLAELTGRMQNLARESLSGQALQPLLCIDSNITLQELNWDLLDWLKKLEPCGNGNPAPLFAAMDVRVVSKRAVGREGSHLKMTLANREKQIDAIGFGFGPSLNVISERINTVFSLEENEYYGKRLQMRIIDIQGIQ